MDAPNDVQVGGRLQWKTSQLCGEICFRGSRDGIILALIQQAIKIITHNKIMYIVVIFGSAKEL